MIIIIIPKFKYHLCRLLFYGRYNVARTTMDLDFGFTVNFSIFKFCRITIIFWLIYDPILFAVPVRCLLPVLVCQYSIIFDFSRRNSIVDDNSLYDFALYSRITQKNLRSWNCLSSFRWIKMQNKTKMKLNCSRMPEDTIVQQCCKYYYLNIIY